MGIDLNKLAHVVLFLVVLPACAILLAWALNASVQSVVPAHWLFLYDTIGVLGAYGVLYKAFDERLWRWQGFRRLSVVDVPDLNGRWIGGVKSSHDGDGAEVKAALEIRQSFTKISVAMYFPKSRSSSIVAGFSRELDGPTALHYEYQNTPVADATDTMHIHQGTASLRFIKASRHLDGSYYNWGRDDRGHVGTMTFRWECKELLEQLG